MSVVVLLCFLVTIRCTSPKLIKNTQNVDPFKQCLITSAPTSLGYCIGVGALNKLQSLDSHPEFNVIDGISFRREDQEVRENINYLERDPSDFRGLIDSFGQVFSRRTMRWDMGFLYPGLSMRMAPSLHNGGLLEFVLDPRHEAVAGQSLKEASTGRLLARQFLVPLLLGFKFNIATIIPVIFGLLVVMAKKAIFLSKLALIASSAFGLGSLLFGAKPPIYGHQGPFASAFGGGYPQAYNRFPPEEYSDGVYRGLGTNEDQLHLYSGVAPQDTMAYTRENQIGNRNFVWSVNEKEGKT